MDVREKLVELLFKCTPKNIKLEWRGEKIEVAISQGNIADYLIDNGVTVQEWISVKDRLPEKPMKCLVYTKRGEYGGYEITYYNEGFYLQYENVTHWMTLPDEPQPPKGE